MEYFYDHQTDQLSITRGDLDHYGASHELAPGVVLHVSNRKQPLAIQVSGAREKVNVAGLVSFEQQGIAPDELAERMKSSDLGRRLWRAFLAPVYLMLVS